MLWLYAIACGVASSVAPGGEIPHRADLVSRFAFALILAFWVSADARKRCRKLCYDYDSFVFFAYVIVVPIYLFQTRGLRAFLTLFCFVGVWVVAMLFVFVLSLIREFAS